MQGFGKKGEGGASEGMFESTTASFLKMTCYPQPRFNKFRVLDQSPQDIHPKRNHKLPNLNPKSFSGLKLEVVEDVCLQLIKAHGA